MNNEDKIENLARMVAQGFAKVGEEMAIIKKEMVTKENLAELREDINIMMGRISCAR